MKPVLLIVIDALTARVVLPAMERGQLPNFAALVQAGTLRPECTSIFPSITPAATASITTGCYPDEHGIAGASWYNADDDSVIYYSDDLWAILRKGMGDFFEDFLVKLNDERLRAPTLPQITERAGIDTAILNFLIFHGDVAHELKVPLLLRLIPGVPSSKTVHGPAGLLLGDFVNNGLDAGGEIPSDASGIADRFGFNDAHSAEVLLHLVRTRTLPPCTIAYFPDNDYRSHDDGPEAALGCFENVDGYLGELAQSYGGMAQMLDDLCVIVVGDHSHCDMADGDAASIALDEVLAGFTLATAGAGWAAGDDLMACLNLRAAQIYLREPSLAMADRVAAALLHDERVDQVIWKPSDMNGSQQRVYIVATRDRGTLRFWPGADGPHNAVDVYGGAWRWDGALAAVDGRVENGQLAFHDYPNAFERLVGGVDHQGAGHLWVTARPGYAFHLPSLSGDEVHAGGGSHGALHACDSRPPLFVAGLPEGVVVPQHPRTIDNAPLCQAILGLEPAHAPGASRIESGERKVM